jgi:hypothetical protein
MTATHPCSWRLVGHRLALPRAPRPCDLDVIPELSASLPTPFTHLSALLTSLFRSRAQSCHGRHGRAPVAPRFLVYGLPPLELAMPSRSSCHAAPPELLASPFSPLAVDRRRSAGRQAVGCRGRTTTGHLTPSCGRLRVSLAALVLVLPSAAAAGDPFAGGRPSQSRPLPIPLWPARGRRSRLPLCVSVSN